MTTALRTDIHAPKNFNPTDYQVIGYLDMKHPEYYFGLPTEVYAAAVEAWRAQILRYFPGYRTGGGDHQSITTCNHCGHAGLRWVAVVKHEPTGNLLAFGEICADRCELSGRDAFAAKYIKTQAALEEARLANLAARAAFEEANPAIVEFLRDLNGDYDSREPEFLLSLKSQLTAKGSLSEAQIAAAEKFIAVRRFLGMAQTYCARHGKPLRYPWPGWLFFSRQWLAGRVPDFNGIRGKHKWDDGDCGSLLHPLFTDADWDRLPTLTHEYGTLRENDGHGLQSYGYEWIDGAWLHFTNASHWKQVPDQAGRDRMMREMLEAL